MEYLPKRFCGSSVRSRIFLASLLLVLLMFFGMGRAYAVVITFEGTGAELDAVTKIGIVNFADSILAQRENGFTAAYVSNCGGDGNIDDTICPGGAPPGVDFGQFFITDPLGGDPTFDPIAFVKNPTDILITFDAPVTAVSFYAFDIDPSLGTVETLGATISDGGAFSQTITITSGDPGVVTGDGVATLFDFGNVTPITSLFLDISPSGSFAFADWGVDNLTFSVPEPGTLALLGAGLLAFGFLNRRTLRTARA